MRRTIGNAWLVYPLLDAVDIQRFHVRFQQRLFQVGQEIFGRHTFERKLIEIVKQEPIEFLTSDLLFQFQQEQRSLLIRDA